MTRDWGDLLSGIFFGVLWGGGGTVALVISILAFTRLVAVPGFNLTLGLRGLASWVAFSPIAIIGFFGVLGIGKGVYEVLEGIRYSKIILGPDKVSMPPGVGEVKTGEYSGHSPVFTQDEYPGQSRTYNRDRPEIHFAFRDGNIYRGKSEAEAYMKGHMDHEWREYERKMHEEKHRREREARDY